MTPHNWTITKLKRSAAAPESAQPTVMDEIFSFKELEKADEVNRHRSPSPNNERMFAACCAQPQRLAHRGQLERVGQRCFPGDELLTINFIELQRGPQRAAGFPSDRTKTPGKWRTHSMRPCV